MRKLDKEIKEILPLELTLLALHFTSFSEFPKIILICQFFLKCSQKAKYWQGLLNVTRAIELYEQAIGTPEDKHCVAAAAIDLSTINTCVAKSRLNTYDIDSKRYKILEGAFKKTKIETHAKLFLSEHSEESKLAVRLCIETADNGYRLTGQTSTLPTFSSFSSRPRP